MHLYFFVRGIYKEVENFKMFMQTQMFKWGRKNLQTGNVEYFAVQGALRVFPFGFEYVFPEECLDEVLTMLNFPEDGKMKGYATMGNKLRLFGLRQLIGNGVYKIPAYKKVQTTKYIPLEGIAIHFIGIKKDERKAMPEWGYEQEML